MITAIPIVDTACATNFSTNSNASVLRFKYKGESLGAECSGDDEDHWKDGSINLHPSLCVKDALGLSVNYPVAQGYFQDLGARSSGK